MKSIVGVKEQASGCASRGAEEKKAEVKRSESVKKGAGGSAQMKSTDEEVDGTEEYRKQRKFAKDGGDPKCKGRSSDF